MFLCSPEPADSVGRAGSCSRARTSRKRNCASSTSRRWRGSQLGPRQKIAHRRMMPSAGPGRPHAASAWLSHDARRNDQPAASADRFGWRADLPVLLLPAPSRPRPTRVPARR